MPPINLLILTGLERYMTLQAFIGASIILIAIYFPVQAQLTPYALPPQAETGLAEGEVFTHVWRDKLRADGSVDVYGAVDIAATPSIIWNIMRDCGRAGDIVKNMKSCDILEIGPDGHWDIRRQVFRVGFLIPNAKTEFRTEFTPYSKMTFTRTGGDMKVQDGEWRLIPLGPEMTRVTYRAAVLPKFPVPKSILKRATYKDTPEILETLKRAALQDMAKQGE